MAGRSEVQHYRILMHGRTRDGQAAAVSSIEEWSFDRAVSKSSNIFKSVFVGLEAGSSLPKVVHVNKGYQKHVHF